MANSTYPNGILAWTPRVDNVSTALAEDVNTLATEVQGVEAIIGTVPQTESNPPVGSAVTYQTMSARLSDANSNNLMPFCALRNTNHSYVKYGGSQFNAYTTKLDPYGLYNGQDITIPAPGLYDIFTTQKWDTQGNTVDGWSAIFLYLNGAWIDAHLFQWLGSQRPPWPSNILGTAGWNTIRWLGPLNTGDRVQVLSANATNLNPMQISNMAMVVSAHRMLPSNNFTFQSGD